MEAGLGAGHIVLDVAWGPKLPLTESWTAAPTFAIYGRRQKYKPWPMHVCGQTAGWIRNPLGTEEASAQATLCYMSTCTHQFLGREYYLSNGLTDRDEIWHGDAYCPSW